MSLTAASMASKVKAKLEAITNWPTPGVNVIIQDMRFITAICDGIIEELTTNGVITPNTFANPSGQAVTVNTGTGIGTTTAPSTITGTGKIT